MRRALAAAGLAGLAAAAAGLPACRAATYVLVSVDGVGLSAVESLTVSVTNGETMGDLAIVGPEAAPIAFPTSFVLRLRAPAAGAIVVCVSTVDPVVPIATGCATGEVVVGDTSTVTIVLVAAPVCGNDVIEPAEDCDGAELGTIGCVDVGGGFTAGDLACTANCTFDASGCYDCGNGAIEAIELCDGPMLGGEDCTTIGMGLSGGALACAPDCTFDPAGCYGCGDGSANPGEACDGSDLAGQSCASIAMGFDGGALACDGACALDTATCCAGTTICWEGGAASSAPCHTGAPVGTCVPSDWEYCNCGSGTAPSVFLDPDDDTGPLTAVTVAGPGLSSVTLSIDGGCFGSTGTPCDPDDPCPPTTTLLRWSIGCMIGPFDLCTPGTHNLTLWNNDGGVPCDGTGTVLLNHTYTVP